MGRPSETSTRLLGGRLVEAVALLRAAAHPLSIILHGSHARGVPSPDSDIDLLVVERSVADRVSEMTRLNRILRPLRLPIDLLVVSEETYNRWVDTQGNVYFDARADGKVLYEAA